MSIGSKVRESREAKGLTPAEYAKLANISQGHLHDIESGRQRGVNVDTLRKLAKGLQMPFEELAEYVE